MTARVLAALTFAFIGHMVVPVFAQSPALKPPVPAGVPARGFAIALLTEGIDYTKPSLASRLARDGEGELIGWDTIDKDRKPYGSNAEATRLVELAPSLVVPIRIDRAAPQSAADAIAFVRRTPARIVVIPMIWTERRDVEPLLAAISAAPNLLFVLAAGDSATDIDATPVYPAALKLDHVITVSALAATDRAVSPSALAQKPNYGRAVDLLLVPPAAAREAPGSASHSPRTSAEAAVMLTAHFSCMAGDLAKATSPADVKRILISKAKRDPASLSPLLESCAPAR